MSRRLPLVFLALALSLPAGATVFPGRKTTGQQVGANDWNGLIDRGEGVVNVAEYLPAGFVRDGSVNYYTQVAALVTAQGTTPGTLVVPFPVKVQTNLTIPATFPVRFEGTGSFTGSGVVTFTPWAGTALVTASGGTTARSLADRASDVVNVVDKGAKGDGVTNDRAAIYGDAMVNAAGKIIYLPPGTYSIDGGPLYYSVPKVHIRGAGRDATVLKMTGAYYLIQSYAGAGHLTLEDLTLDASGAGFDAIHIDGSGAAAGGVIRNVRIINARAGNAIYLSGAKGWTLENVEVEGDGSATSGSCLSIVGGSSDIRVQGGRCRWSYNGIFGDYASNVEISGVTMDGGWWFWPTYVSRSGAGVTYTSTTMVDTSHPTWTAAAASDTIRALPARSSGTASAIGASTLTGNGNFVSDGVEPGDLVRIGSSEGVVSKVNSTTLLTVEEWLATASLAKLVPAAGAYTVHQVVVGRITGAPGAGNTVTVESWRIMNSGATWSALTAGTLYEIAKPHPNYQGLKCMNTCTGWNIHNNTFLRSWSDQLSYQGSRGILADNFIRDGQDTGITTGDEGAAAATYNSVRGNVIVHQGAAGGAECGTDNEWSDNYILDPGWVLSNSGTGISTTTGAVRNRFVNTSVLRRSSSTALMFYGITDGGGASTVADANRWLGGMSRGAATADITATNLGAGPTTMVVGPDLAYGTAILYASSKFVRPPRTPYPSADRGDTSQTLTAGTDEMVQRWATTLTANRTVTLSTTNAVNGDSFRVVRTGLGAFTLDVGGLKTIAAGTAAFVDVAYNGSAWVLTGYGAL